MFSCVSFTRRNTKESRKGSGTAKNTSGRSNQTLTGRLLSSSDATCSKGNREIFTSVEHVHGLQVGGHPLQRHGFQVGLSVAVVPVCGRSRQSSISLANSWSSTLLYSLFGEGKLLWGEQRRLARLPGLLFLQHVREELFNLV